MPDRKEPKIPPRIKERYLTLRPETIEKTFTDAVTDLKQIVILDVIDILPDNSGFQVRSHDLHGPLPELLIQDSGDSFLDKDRLGREACKLVAIVRLRDQMLRFLPGSKLLPPTSMDGKAIAGLKGGGRGPGLRRGRISWQRIMSCTSRLLAEGAHFPTVGIQRTNLRQGSCR